MSLTAYCDYDEIRSALGVNSIELADKVLGLPVYEMGLVRELNKLSTSLNAAFSTVRLLAPPDRTDPQATLYNATRLFSVYACAKQVGVSLANFAAKEVGDGKANVVRQSGDSVEDVLDNVEAMYVSLREELRAAWDAYSGTSGSTPSSVPATAFVAVKRLYDPVTGV